MSKYCLRCGKEKEWEHPTIEGEPLLCDTCQSKSVKAITKLLKLTRHNHTTIRYMENK